MNEREIGTGASCFLVKDKRIIGDWSSTAIHDFLESEGFINWGKAKSQHDVDWLYINIYSKVYSKGIYGVGLTKVVGDHAITFNEFFAIYNIYKKYEGLDVLKMSQAEQDEFNEKHPYQKMQKIIGCEKLTHEIVGEYLSRGFWNTRELLPWEHCGKKFQKLCVPMKRSFLNDGIHLCNYNDKSYYFGIGLDEPEVTEDMLQNGYWCVYTWSD
jgi:hypothetical protein